MNIDDLIKLLNSWKENGVEYVDVDTNSIKKLVSCEYRHGFVELIGVKDNLAIKDTYISVLNPRNDAMITLIMYMRDSIKEAYLDGKITLDEANELYNDCLKKVKGNKDLQGAYEEVAESTYSTMVNKKFKRLLIFKQYDKDGNEINLKELVSLKKVEE